MAGTGQGNESAQQAGGVPETGRLAGKDQDQEKKPYESKDEPYFSYYSLLSHQAQMLQVSRLLSHSLDENLVATPFRASGVGQPGRYRISRSEP